MVRNARIRSVALALALGLVTSPLLAAERGARKDDSFLASLWQALVELLPGTAAVGGEVGPEGAEPLEDPNGDLGPELDPLGTPGN